MPDVDVVSTITETGAPQGANGNGASGGVAASGAGETGQPQGDKPSLSPLYDQLPKAVRPNIKAERFSKLSKLEDLTAEIDRLDGEVATRIKVPGKDATNEQRAQYRKALGVPDTPEGYTIVRPTLPEGMRYNEDFEKWARAQFHELGVPAETAKEILNRYNALQLNGFKTLSEQRTKAAAEAESKKKTEFANGEAVLREQWGGAYNERVAGVKQMLREGKVIPSKWVEKITKAGLDNDPDTLFVLDQMRRYTREDRKIGLDGEVHDIGVDENVDPKTGRRFIKHKRTLQRESE